MEKKINTPRGIRNCNPLNIVHSLSNWRGMAQEQPDRKFVTFRSMPWGIRAAFKILQTYHSRWRCCALSQYIRRWAPPIENDTKAYTAFVAKEAGIKSDVLLPSPRKNEVLWCKIVAAMIRMECAQKVNDDLIHQGWHLAFDEV